MASQSGKHRVVVSVIAIVWIADILSIGLAFSKFQLVDPNQLIGCSRPSRWTQEKSVDQAVNRRVDADAEGKRDHRHSRKAWVFEEHSKGVTKVIKHAGSGLSKLVLRADASTSFGRQNKHKT